MNDGTIQECAICGQPQHELTRFKRCGTWLVCGRHKVWMKELRYNSRCAWCLKTMAAGTEAWMCKEGGNWTFLHAWAEDCYGNVEKPNNPGFGIGAAYKVLHLTTDAPIEVVRAAYKALSFLHHPDRGGDAERMAKINGALDEIMRGGR